MIEGAARKKCDGSGFSFLNGARDLSFTFAQERFAKAAKTRVKETLGRKVVARVDSPEVLERNWRRFCAKMNRRGRLPRQTRRQSV
jgi:hypothetical protein